MLLCMISDFGQKGPDGSCGFPAPLLSRPTGVENHPRDIESSFVIVGNNLAVPKPILAPIAQFQERHGIAETAAYVANSLGPRSGVLNLLKYQSR